MRRDSWRSVPMMCRPPAATTLSWRSCQSARMRASVTSSSPALARGRCGLLEVGFELPPSLMSVPRPAMFVAMVTLPGMPAFSTMCASRSCCFALSTSCAMLFSLSTPESSSEVSMDVVPTSTGCSRFTQSSMSSMIALNLSRLRQIDEVRVVLADHRPVRRDHDHFEAVDLHELRRFGVGGAGHARELLVEAEVVLERDRRDGLVFRAHLHAFLRLDRLVQAIGPAPAGHRAAREFVDDDHFAVAHDVFHVALVERVRAQRRVQVMHQPDVRGVVETLAFAQQARTRASAARPARDRLRSDASGVCFSSTL